ncbi:uncharacterized protein LOC144907522 [Branchiostoma floridae x Branchiostoma belcheri]
MFQPMDSGVRGEVGQHVLHPVVSTFKHAGVCVTALRPSLPWASRVRGSQRAEIFVTSPQAAQFDVSETNVSWPDWQDKWKTGKFLPPDYDSTTAPKEIGGMDVSSSVYILNIGTLSEKNANISVRIQYTLSWADSRLFGIAQSWVPVPPALVWSPPLGFGQSVRRVSTEEEGDTAMWLDPRGMVSYKMTYASDMVMFTEGKHIVFALCFLFISKQIRSMTCTTRLSRHHGN